jgi:hypothetical protein
MEVIVKDKGFRSEIDKSRNIMLAKQTGFVGTEELKSFWTKTFDAILQYKVEKLIVDSTESKIMTAETKHWFETELFPSVMKRKASGKLDIARVESTDTFAKLSANAINKMANEIPNFKMVTFKSMEEAKAWLEVE